MIYHYSQSIRRSVAVGLLLFIIALFYLLVISPFISSVQENALRIYEKRLQLGRFVQIGKKTPMTTDNVEGLEKYRSRFFAGISDDVVLITIHKKVKQITSINGAQFRSAQSLAIASQKQRLRLGVRVELTGDIKALKKVIHAIETTTPYLIIDHLSLRPMRQFVGQGATTNLFISTQFDVFGLTWPERKG